MNIDNGTIWPSNKTNKTTKAPTITKTVNLKTTKPVHKMQTVEQVINDNTWIIGDAFPSFVD